MNNKTMQPTLLRLVATVRFAHLLLPVSVGGGDFDTFQFACAAAAALCQQQQQLF